LTSENGPDLDLCSLVPCRRVVADRSQMQPTAAICRWSRDIRGMDLETFPQVSLRKTEEPRQKRDPFMVDRSEGQCFIDPPVSGLLAAVAYARRVGDGDVEALVLMVGLAEETDAAIAEAVRGLRACGYSWAEIGSRLGITRQAAQQRWGAS